MHRTIAAFSTKLKKNHFVHSFFASKNLLMRYYFFEKLAIVVNLNAFFMNM